MPNTVARGTQGVVVRELQHNLARRGVPIKVDGVFGPKTEAAVRQFQSSAHLPVDGIAGAHTWAALHDAPVAPRRSVERASALGANFEQMLRKAGEWFEEHGASTPTPSAGGSTAREKASPPAGAGRVAPTAAKPSPKIVDAGLSGHCRRISFDGYEGRGWVVQGYSDVLGEQIWQLDKGGFLVNPVGSKTIFQRSECVALVRYLGVPKHNFWRRGPQVCAFKPGELPAGTVIATMRDGYYHSDYSGRSHVAIYLSHDDYDAYLSTPSKVAGVKMLNQWNRNRVQRTNRPYAVNADQFQPGGRAKKAWIYHGKPTRRRLQWIKDGEEYFVVLTR